jgi:hypothetical protein
MRGWIVMLILSSSAIARAGDADDDDDLKGFVLVWSDATFYVDPSADAATLTFAKIDRSSPAQTVGHVIAMRVGKRKGDFIQVEPADHACAGSGFGARDVGGLSLFIKEDAIAPVLVRPWQRDFDDGSRISLEVGESVVPLDGGGAAFEVEGVVLHGDIPAPSIGTSYRFNTLATDDVRRDAYGLVTVHQNTTGSLAGHPFVVGDEVVEQGPLPEVGHDHVAVDLPVRCGAARAVVPSSAIESYDYEKRRGVAIGNPRSTPPAPPRTYIPAKTWLSTPSGRPAGVTSSDLHVDLDLSGHPKDVCFDVAVRYYGGGDLGEQSMKLCAPAKVVRRSR